MGELEQDAVGIAVHDAFDRAVRIVGDRVGHLDAGHVEFPRIGDELPSHRIGGIGRIDAAGEAGRDRHRVARGDPLQRGAVVGRCEPGGDQIVGAAQGFGVSWP